MVRTRLASLALALPLAFAALPGCASDIGLTGFGDATLPDDDDGVQEGPQDGQQPPQDGQQPPQDGQQPPEDGQQPPQDGQQPPGGEGGAGPAPCDLDADCEQACPPDAIGCVCAVDPQGMSMCVPECEVDEDCPAPPDMTLVCDSIEAICVPEGM